MIISYKTNIHVIVFFRYNKILIIVLVLRIEAKISVGLYNSTASNTVCQKKCFSCKLLRVWFKMGLAFKGEKAGELQTFKKYITTIQQKLINQK